jgi:hypothetical protein
MKVGYQPLECFQNKGIAPAVAVRLDFNVEGKKRGKASDD